MARTEAPPSARLADAFARGRAEGRALVMPFLVCGYPDDDTFVSLARACAEAGADVLEIGIPFSDPIMDGPVIAAASHAVRERGTPVSSLLVLAGRAAQESGIPIVLMTYYNLVFRAGLERFASTAVDRGAAGVIIPDLPVEESDPWRTVSTELGLAPVFIAALTSTPERVRAIAHCAGGFIYAASLLGVTGVRERLNERARALVERIRAETDLPIAVGIGVSTADHVRAVARFADGVIVGSAIVERIADTSDPVADVCGFVAELREAVAR